MDLVIITGATRGYGQSIAEQYSKTISRPQEFVLMGRTVEGLEETKKLVLNNNDKANVRLYQVDLYDAVDFQKKFEAVFAESPVEKYNRAILIHNAGTIGKMAIESQLVTSIDDINDIQKEFLINVTSVIALNAHFIKKFKGTLSKEQLIIVNISSGAAYKPADSWGIYCSTKAARKMLHEILASEEKDSLRVVSFAPGIFDSKLQESVRASSGESSIKSFLTQTYKDGKMTPIHASSGFLVELLESGGFTSGEHVELYQRKPDLSPFAK